MIKKIETLIKRRPAALLCGALALALLPSAGTAGNPKDRYECIAKAAGRSFTNGAITLKGYPCRVAPAEVDRLTKTKGADIKTDQINFDYFWNQAYFTKGRTLTDIRDSGERETGAVKSITFVYRAVCQKGNLEASGAFAKIKEALGFEMEPSTAEIAGQIYSLCDPFDKTHYQNAVMEENADNKSQLLLYTSTANADKKKLMGAVNWIAQEPVPGAVPAEAKAASAEAKAASAEAKAASVHEAKKDAIVVSTGDVQAMMAAADATDTDGDGVPDGVDECPTTPSRTVVDTHGCFPGAVKRTPVVDETDSDGDGVPDSLDKCPNTPPRTVVDSKGCFPDEDGDNVSDSRDKCPGTPKGTPVDVSGCAAK